MITIEKNRPDPNETDSHAAPKAACVLVLQVVEQIFPHFLALVFVL